MQGLTLPGNVQLLTLQATGRHSLLLRLAHLYQARQTAPGNIKIEY